MKVELKANGKSVQAEISEEQLKELGLCITVNAILINSQRN